MKNLYNAIINLLPSTTLKEKIIETNFNISDYGNVYAKLALRTKKD